MLLTHEGVAGGREDERPLGSDSRRTRIRLPFLSSPVTGVAGSPLSKNGVPKTPVRESKLR